jgi:hypothetical protein
MSLVEVMIAIAVFTVIMGGLLAAFIQSRRLTESSIYQNTAVTIVTGYLEQMKSMSINSLINADTGGNAQLGSSYAIPTMYSDALTDPLQTSTGSPPALSSITPGVTPAGGAIVDNLKTFDMMKDLSAQNYTSTDTSNTTVARTWSQTWPGAQAFPTTTPGAKDLHLNLWVWVTDLSGTASYTNKVYGITIMYTYQVLDGARARYFTGIARSIRSTVPSY